MDDDDRLGALMERLSTHWQDHPARRRPPRIPVGDAAAIARRLHEEMDRGTAARDAHAVSEGLTLACEPGCSHCCENLIFVFRGEALAVSEWLALPENADARAWFLDGYTRWREAVGDAPERASAARESKRRDAYEQAVREVWSRRVMCAFNRDGVCSIYPVRPNHCRKCHALSTSDRCVSSSEQPPQAIEFPPLDAFLQKIHPLMDAMHVSLGNKRGVPEPLCDVVYRALRPDERKPASTAPPKVRRNGPCPCGSGLKYKRCCESSNTR